MAVVAHEGQQHPIQHARAFQVADHPAELVVEVADRLAVLLRTGGVLVGCEVHRQLVHRADRRELPVFPSDIHHFPKPAHRQAVHGVEELEDHRRAGRHAVLEEMRRSPMRLEKQRERQAVGELIVKRGNRAALHDPVLVLERLEIAEDQAAAVEPLGGRHLGVAGGTARDDTGEVVDRQRGVAGDRMRHVQAPLKEVCSNRGQFVGVQQ